MSGGGGTIGTSESRLGAVQVQQSSYGLAIPIVYGRTRVTGNLIWYGDFVAIAHTTTTSAGGKGGGGVSQQNTTYTYEAATMMALCEGPVGGVVSVWQAKKCFEAIAAAPGVEAKTALEQLNLSFASGAAGQAAWSHLTGKHAAQALGYSSTTYVCSPAFELTTNAEVQNHSFELDGKLQYGGSVVDANPADIVYDLLTSTQYGAGFPVSSIADLSTYSAYCRAMGLFISPAFTEQQEAQEHLRMVASLTNSAYVWSEGKLKLVPYGDEAITGNGVTFTPNLTPEYDLTNDDFLVTGSEDPVTCTRKTTADAYNQVQVEFLNRANAYNIEIVEAKDQANIEKYGLRPQDPIKMHGICDISVARSVAQMLLQRALYVRNEYEFRLGWKYALLEPMDLVTLTEPGLGLKKTPVRIEAIEEDEDGQLTVTAEDYPFGVASATRYPTQSGAGYSANYNVVPGDVSTPVFFEAPIELATSTGLEVWCAVSGHLDVWGGCNVWASTDGSTYKQIGTMHGGARYGALSASIGAASTGPLSVALAGQGGQMLSGTAQDAELLNTLCWVGDDTGGEFMAYQTATLNATNAYALTSLVRGAYGSVQAAHATGKKFVRVDQAIVKSDPLDVAMLDKKIYFKFCSFNIFGGGLQGLSEVAAFEYTITGSMIKLPPSNVEGLSLTVETGGIRVSWAACTDADYASTIIKVGTNWAAASVVTRKNATSHLMPFVSAGQLKVWAAHVDQFDNESAAPVSATLIITPPAPVTNLSLASTTTGLQANWRMAALGVGSLPVDRVELSWSSNFAAVVEAKKSTTATFAWVSPGLKELFVRVVDVAGNISNSSLASITVRSPSAPAALTVVIGTSGATASWNAPAVATDQQALAGVQLSWAADFSPLIDTRSASSAQLGWLAAGSYTLYARYVDAAGNTGSAASTTFSVAAPSAPSSFSVTFGTANIEAKWSAPSVAANQQALDRVELSWAPEFTTIIDGKKSTTTTFGWMTAGSYVLYARYVDVAGNIGAVSQAALQVLAPNQPQMTSVETQINAVTLRWQDAKTVQPIRKYAIRYGEAGTLFVNAVLYGSAGADSRSDILFYRSSGSKVAFLVAEDVAGNQSTPCQINLSITMPNNFVLASEYFEDWQSAELTNGAVIGGASGQIILPALDGRTWGQRLSNSGWTTAQQKIDAGYPIVMQPVPSTGKHVEQHDLGKVLATGIVRVTPTLQSSVPGYTATIRIRGSSGDTNTAWQSWLVGDSASISGFRYIEVEYAVMSDGKGFVVLDDLSVKVEISEITESTTLALSAADSAGTAYVCTKPFLDVRTAQATALGSSNIARVNCIVDDTILPAKVYVQAWDTSNNRTGGTVSLYITGV